MSSVAATSGSTNQWAAVQKLTAFRWPRGGRIVVVSPHPDDETLGAGGLIAMATQRLLEVVVISVTNGEAAYVQDNLAAVRRQELGHALRCLSLPRTIGHHYLGLPDGRLHETEEELDRALQKLLKPTDLVVCTLEDDGHDDHAACARATIRTAHRIGATVRCFPVWSWLGDRTTTSPILKGERLNLSLPAQARKRRAIATFTSQIESPHEIVPQSLIDQVNRGVEIFVDPGLLQCG